VVTGRGLDRKTFERHTAETLVSLTIGATSRIRLFTPFVDSGGIAAIAHALAAASARRVSVTFGYRVAADRMSAVRELQREVEHSGDRRFFRIVPLPESEIFPHLKLLAIDGRRAYIGSANVTYSGLTDNVEIGAIVEGTAVVVYEALFDDLVRSWVGDDGAVA
jgi:phosphatidylserine/phosphatidylglycerophosphate/cardiolipin synthase-like enzyme